MPEAHPSERLTAAECRGILTEFKSWNLAQTSFSLAFRGKRTAEDDIYDARRALILKATRRLAELA